MLSSISGSLDSFVYRKKSILITVPCNSLLPFSFLEIGQSSIIWPKGRNLVVALFIVIIRVCAYNMLLIRDQGRNLCYQPKKQLWHSYSIRGNPINIRAYGKQCINSISL